MGRPKPIAKDLLASIPSDVDAQPTQALPPPKPKRIKKAQPKAKGTQIESEDALLISKLAESDKSQPSARKRRSEAQPFESPKSKKPKSSSATTLGSKKHAAPWAIQNAHSFSVQSFENRQKLANMKKEFSSLQKANKNLQSKMKRFEDQADVAIKAQTEAEEKAESFEAIRKVAESQRKEAKEKMAQAEKELQKALATKEAEIKDADKKAYAQGMANVTEAYEKQLNVPEDSPLRKADAIPLPFPLSAPLSQDVSESESKDDKEGDEVPKDAAHEKVSADVPFADKSTEETLQEIDAELTAEKAAEVASQQSSEVPTQLTVDAEEP
ncbi:KNR4/SMI1 homolog [Camellia sinensis]|uniref:KNR4/SMI1 homolog n=1 Tax=Camellia sinensis TaxID=4442 RepID=UPI00103654B4|nr:KNR4/SMI1 homolog [Camellia sinensis]